MTVQALFCKAYKTRRILFYTAQDENSRVHLIIGGDFIQLPPVVENVFFETPQLSVDHKNKFNRRVNRHE